MKKLLTYIGLTVLSIILGFWLSADFFTVSLSELNLNNTDLTTTSLKSQFNQSMLLCLALGIIRFCT